MIDPNSPNQTLLNQLAQLCGLFGGSKGHPSITVHLDDGTDQEYPLPMHTASRVKYCRLLLAEHGRSPTSDSD
jgi:hypothetical protein